MSSNPKAAVVVLAGLPTGFKVKLNVFGAVFGFETVQPDAKAVSVQDVPSKVTVSLLMP